MRTKRLGFKAAESWWLESGLSQVSSCAETEPLAFIPIIPKWVEESHSQVDEHGQVEGDAAPEGDVPGEPEQGRVV